MALQHSHMPTFTPDHFEYNTLPHLVIKNICETFLQTGFFHNFPEAFLWHYFDVNLDSTTFSTHFHSFRNRKAILGDGVKTRIDVEPPAPTWGQV